MFSGLACLVILYCMYHEIIDPKVHLHYYAAVQYLISIAIGFTAFAFMLDDPFHDDFKWWPWYVNWASFAMYILTLRRVCLDKYRVYSIWWFW